MTKAPHQKPRAEPKAKARPSIWHFPTSDPDVALACAWNAKTERYDTDCKLVRIDDIAKPIRASFRRLVNSCARCDM